ncbi:hypothetical protein QYF36_020761 [Acer negundo]|nr:hypothetical protein QYF36_020761 [Acer negundo]
MKHPAASSSVKRQTRQSHRQSIDDAVKAATFSPEPPQPETEKVEEEISTVKRKMKHTAASSSVKRQTRQSHRQSINDAGDTYESLSLINEKAASESPGKDMKNTTDKNSPDEPMPKEFVSDPDSLVDSLAQPRSETPLPQTVTVNSPPQENDLAAAQRLKENKAKLALLRQEYKELKENQAKVTSLRQEYNELKENATLLKIEIDSNSSSVQGIDDQISQLKSQRAELKKTIETKKMARFNVLVNQKKVAEAIKRTADEILLYKARKLKENLHHPGNCWLEMELMEVDGTSESSETMPKINGNGIHLPEVSTKSSGYGLPYAPINWPKPGDNRRWKMGKRVAIKGHFSKTFKLSGKLNIDMSSVPHVHQCCLITGNVEGRTSSPPLFKDTGEDPGSDSQSDGVFCANCCCVLCNKFINLNYGGYSYIKCEAKVSEDYICGHVAHLNCALRCSMAGTVGGDIGLDAEYCCQRCDAKTDLILHATRFVQTCKSVDCQDDIEKILNVGVCILRDSQKTKGKGSTTANTIKKPQQDQLQTSSSSIQGIDDQIAQLKSRREELTRTVRTRKMAKFNVLGNQKKLPEAITRTEDEILLSEAQKRQVAAEEGKCSHA